MVKQHPEKFKNDNDTPQDLSKKSDFYTAKKSKLPALPKLVLTVIVLRLSKHVLPFDITEDPILKRESNLMVLTDKILHPQFLLLWVNL